MTVTPRDIRTVTFGKPALGRRGYSEDDVDPFLEQVAVELEARLEEIDRLRDSVESLNHDVEMWRLNAEPTTEPITRLETDPGSETAHVTEILVMAAETADRYKREAQQKAERQEQQARDAAQRILTQARDEGTRIIEGAREQGRTALAEYEQQAENVQVMLNGLRDRLRPYFEQNIRDLDMLIPSHDEVPTGAHAHQEE